MASITKPLTIEEFEKLDLPKDRLWELHGGELVEMGFPNWIHKFLQYRLQQILIALFRRHCVLVECSFHVVAANYERAADVGLVEQGRTQHALQHGILDGTPELVIEVVSPSNSGPELNNYRLLCFSNQTLIFCLVYPDSNEVHVYRKGERPAIYELNDSVSLSLLGTEASIPVRDIFTGITLS